MTCLTLPLKSVINALDTPFEFLSDQIASTFSPFCVGLVVVVMVAVVVEVVSGIGATVVVLFGDKAILIDTLGRVGAKMLSMTINIVLK